MIILGIADLGINLPVLVAQLVNFTVLLILLRMVAWGPLMKMLDERRERIAESLNAADAAKAQVAESERQARRRRPTPTRCSLGRAARSSSSGTALSPTFGASSLT